MLITKCQKLAGNEASTMSKLWSVTLGMLPSEKGAKEVDH